MNTEACQAEKEKENIPELSDEEYALAVETRNIVRTQIPEFIPWLIELGKIGWIDGWRSVRAWKIKHSED
jgi:hypothetical protein